MWPTAKRCSACTSEDNKNQWRSNRESRTAATKRWVSINRSYVNAQRVAYNLKNKERNLVNSARRSAKQRGLPFDLSCEDIVIPERCPVLGIPIVLNTAARADDSPSLDRIVPALGYVKGNVIVISWRANRLKQDASIAELRALADFYGRYVLS